jgi:hypothetical protein
MSAPTIKWCPPKVPQTRGHGREAAAFELAILFCRQASSGRQQRQQKEETAISMASPMVRLVPGVVVAPTAKGAFLVAACHSRTHENCRGRRTAVGHIWRSAAPGRIPSAFA